MYKPYLTVLDRFEPRGSSGGTLENLFGQIRFLQV
jgi:hypothetical protein